MPKKTEPRERLAANIKRLRTAGGWSQAQCAEEIGVTPGAWYHWENGTRTPDWDLLDKIAASLGVTASDLLD